MPVGKIAKRAIGCRAEGTPDQSHKMPSSIITSRRSKLNHPGKPAKGRVRWNSCREPARPLDEFIAHWQVKRDGRRRGIVEVKA